jgi:Zn-dependent M16 (insulinase) family peptidase
MFAKELVMYVDYLEELISQTSTEDKAFRKLIRFQKNLMKGMDYCLEIAEETPYEGENLQSLKDAVHVQRERLEMMFEPAMA